MFRYRCRVRRTIDGDTLDLFIDQGFHSFRVERVRLLGVDCPEVTGKTKPAGLAARDYTAAWVRLVYDGVRRDTWPFEVETVKTDAFGRYLARLWREGDEIELSSALLRDGHAVPFPQESK